MQINELTSVDCESLDRDRTRSNDKQTDVAYTHAYINVEKPSITTISDRYR